MQNIYTPDSWTDYELLDTGDGEKLERFGDYKIVRPDPRVLWAKSTSREEWLKQADAVYNPGNDLGQWQFKKRPPENWQIKYKNLTFSLRPTDFKHVGVFPEQAVNWDWLSSVIGGRKINLLNLFAYTGGATLAAAKAGANVTHVDSLKQILDWAHQNAKLTKIPDSRIRWIPDDAVKFAAREVRRGTKYDGIILDPPRFGRGTKGEVWKLSEDLPKLLKITGDLLSEDAKFVLVNAYTADLSTIALDQLLKTILKHSGGCESGELALKESARGFLLPSGLFARWSRVPGL